MRSPQTVIRIRPALGGKSSNAPCDQSLVHCYACDIPHVHKPNGERPRSEASAEIINLSADVVAAYVSNNSVPRGDLATLIAVVHSALRDAANEKQKPEAIVLEPPVSMKKSITANHLISMEDGRPYKSLKRHMTARGLTPELL
jgi:hypothetical protein